MFCQECGTQLDDGSEFCSKCGAKIGESKQPVKKTKSYMHIPIFILGVIITFIGVMMPEGWYTDNGSWGSMSVYDTHPHKWIVLFVGVIFLAIGLAKYIRSK